MGRVRLAVGFACVLIALLVPSVQPAPASDGTFGRAAPGSAWHPMGADYKRSSRFALAQAGAVTDIVAYLDGLGGASGTQQIRFALYADVGGEPAELLAESAIGTIAAGAPQSWVKLPLASPRALAAGSYHLAILSGATGWVTRYSREPLAGGLRHAEDAFGDGASDPYGPAERDDFEVAIHAVVAPDATVRAPENTVLPEVSGAAQAGQTLAGSTGTWSNSPTSYAYQWRRCDAAGTSCTDIAGASAASYTLTAADVGTTIRVAVTASNVVGSSSAVSAPTGTVATVTAPVESGNADARVEEANPATNFGSFKTLRVVGGGNPDVETYLRFTVSGLSGAVGAAKLRLYATSDTIDGPTVYAAPSEWTEPEITWSNRPARLSGAIADAGPIVAANWVEYDVTPLVTGNGSYSFLLATTSSDGVNFSSREGEYAPQLAVTETSCDKVAGPTGSDTNSGSVTSPYKTVQKLTHSLSAGQTGCLRAGEYAEDEVTLDVEAMTLTSFPGERATLSGRLRVTADRVVVERLVLDGRNTENLPSPTINADDVVFRDNDVSSRGSGICFILGTSGEIQRPVIERNRIHDCGNSLNIYYDHGIYMQNVDYAQILGNTIYDNVSRGIKVGPDAHHSLIRGNVIDGNAIGLNFSGTSETASSNNVVEHNVISYSTGWWNVQTYWPGDLVGHANEVRSNCVYAHNANPFYNTDGGISGDHDGFTARDNVVAKPRYVRRAAKDFRLRSDSGCRQVYQPWR